MPRGVVDSRNLLWAEGEQVVLDFNRTTATSTTAGITWTIPVGSVYDGILITASIKEINPSNLPTDGIIYNASTDLTAPVSMINNAQVIVALYGNQTTTSAALTGLDPAQVYFLSAHIISNVRTYYTLGVRSYPESIASSVFAGEIPRSFSPPISPVIGQVYFDETQNLLFSWDGTTWLTTSTNNVLTGSIDPVSPFTGYPTGYPTAGSYFYNTRLKMLKSWNGAGWISAETEFGIPSYQKAGVGTDLTYSPRANLIDILKKQLGYPQVCVELTEDQFNIAIENALQEIRRRTDVAYFKQYFFMQIHANQDLYYLNDPLLRTDGIVGIQKIHRLNTFGLMNFAPDNIYTQQFLNSFYAPGVGYDLVSIFEVQQLTKVYSQIFASEIAFNWREATRELKIYKRFGAPEKVLVETTCEKPEQELLQDRWTQQWIQAWAESELLFILAHIRGKFASLPGPGGGLQLNADSLISQATVIQENCLREIRDMEVGQQGSDNFHMPFTFG